METALEILSYEHQNILKVIRALLKECDSLQTGNKTNKVFLGRIIDFVREYADRFHHAKEEDILFKEFNKCAEEGRVHCNPVEQMLYEHNRGRNFIKELEKEIKNDNKDKIVENARRYAQLLQEHIFKEDNILYPMMDEALSQKTKSEMLERFKEVELKLSNEKHNHLSFIKSLANNNQ